MIDSKRVTRFILKNIENGIVLLDDISNNRVMIEEDKFVKSFCCKNNFIFVEVIRELPRKTIELKEAEEVNRLNGETFLEKYFITEERGKKYFNMSLTYTLHDDAAEPEIKVLINYITKQAKAAYRKLVV